MCNGTGEEGGGANDLTECVVVQEAVSNVWSTGEEGQVTLSVV